MIISQKKKQLIFYKVCRFAIKLNYLKLVFMEKNCSNKLYLYFQVLEYLVRDYIKDWYDELTDNQEFYHHIQSCLHELIRAFASRFSKILKYFNIIKNLF